MFEYWTILREGGGESILITFNNLKPLLAYSLKHKINKIHRTSHLSWNPNWENQKHFLLLQNYICNCFCKLQLAENIDPQVSHIQLKDATTPCFVSYNWQDDSTPYLPTTTGRRLWTPSLSATTERMLWHHVYQLPLEGGYDPLAFMLSSLVPLNLPYMIIWFMIVLHQSIC